MQIHRGSPWVVPRPVFILALPRADSDGHAMYVLRTRVAMPAAENEFTKVSATSWTALRCLNIKSHGTSMH